LGSSDANMNLIIDKLIRSNRRSIGLEITADAKLVVHAPLRITKQLINEAVEQKSAWVIQKQKEALRRHEKHLPKQCEDGESFLLLGKPLTLIYEDSAKKIEVRGENLFVPTKKRDTAKEAITTWYKAQVLLILHERVAFYATSYGIKYDSLKVTSALSRWGSCSGNSRLCFTWRLVLAPVEMIDYVVIHELSHIGHPDHSKAFWGRVGELMPDFEIRRKWFRDNAALLRPDFFTNSE
jgi:predicted metal-dependent hydrolase